MPEPTTPNGHLAMACSRGDHRSCTAVQVCECPCHAGREPAPVDGHTTTVPHFHDDKDTIRALREKLGHFRSALERVESHGSGVAVTIAREALNDA